MASGVSNVTVLGLNGRKYPLKVTPNTSILQVLEEACKRQNVSPNDYQLKHYNKTLDLSLSLRFANIPNNAMLELHPADRVRIEGNVTVGIQLESGERLMGDFSPSSFVWDVVLQCLSKRENSDHGDNGSSVPVCLYMRETMSEEEMKRKTLRSLGLTQGKAMFRLRYQQAEQLQEQAHVSSPLTKSTKHSAFSEPYPKTACVESSGSAFTENSALDKQEQESETTLETECQELPYTTPCSDEPSTSNKSDVDHMWLDSSFPTEYSIQTSSNLPVADNINLSGLVSSSCTGTEQLVSKNFTVEEVSSPEKPMDIDSVSEDLDSQGSESRIVNIIGDRHAMLFNMDDVASMPKIEVPEDFYEVTVEDARYLMDEYKRARQELENRPLELKSQKQNENLQHLANAQTVIRVHFPDRLVLQGIFFIGETVKSVMEFVQSFLQNKEFAFYLYKTPPKENLSPDKTLFQAELYPAANIYFGCAQHFTSYLEPSYLNKLSDPQAANKAASEFRTKNISVASSSLQTIHIDENVNVHPQQDLDLPSTSNTHSIRTENSDSKMPKWLKLSKR